MRKPTWKKTKKAMEASASASSKKAAQDPAPPVMDLAALFDAIGEFPVSNIRQEGLEPRVPSVSELHRHAERYWSPLPSSPVPQRDPSPSPSPVSSVKRRKQRMNLRAIRYEDRFPVYPRWKPYDMEENLFPECSRCLSPELCGRNGRVHSCIHRTAARKSSKTVEVRDILPLLVNTLSNSLSGLWTSSVVGWHQVVFRLFPFVWFQSRMITSQDHLGLTMHARSLPSSNVCVLVRSRWLSRTALMKNTLRDDY